MHQYLVSSTVGCARAGSRPAWKHDRRREERLLENTVQRVDGQHKLGPKIELFFSRLLKTFDNMTPKLFAELDGQQLLQSLPAQTLRSAAAQMHDGVVGKLGYGARLSDGVCDGLDTRAAPLFSKALMAHHYL